MWGGESSEMCAQMSGGKVCALFFPSLPSGCRSVVMEMQIPAVLGGCAESVHVFEKTLWRSHVQCYGDIFFCSSILDLSGYRSPMGFRGCIFKRSSMDSLCLIIISNCLLTRSQDLVFPSVCTVFCTGSEILYIVKYERNSKDFFYLFFFIISFVYLLFVGVQMCLVFYFSKLRTFLNIFPVRSGWLDVSSEETNYNKNT